MVDEKESGAKFFGMTLKSLEGEVKSPDGFKMFVDVENPSFGFVVIEMTALGEDAFIKFSADAPWLPLPLDQVPFNFGELGPVLGQVLPAMENTEITGRESIGGVESIRVEGDATSEDLADLIPTVDAGHTLRLGFWFSEADHTITQFQILGKILNDDAPETSRLITISNINLPVEIQLPDTSLRVVKSARSGLTALGSSQSVILGILCLGVFSTALDQTVVVAALPSVMVDLEIPLTDLDTASWIVTAYLVSYTVAMPLAGRLSDVYGRVRMFQAALVLFSIGSALVAVAPNFPWVVTARVLQAAGGGATVPIGLAMAVGTVEPQKRGMALGAGGGLGGGGVGAGAVVRRGDNRVARVAVDILAGHSAELLPDRTAGNPAEPGQSRGEDGLRRGGGAGRGADGPEPGAFAEKHLFRGVDSPVLHDSRGSLVGRGVDFDGEACAPAVAGVIPVQLPCVFVLQCDAVPGRRGADNLPGSGALDAATVMEKPAWESALHLFRLTAAIPVGAILGGYILRWTGVRPICITGLAFIGIGLMFMSGWDTDVEQLRLTAPLVITGLGFGLVIPPITVSALSAAPGDYWGGGGPRW